MKSNSKAQLKKLVKEELAQREVDCQKDLNDVLEKYRCSIVSRAIIQGNQVHTSVHLAVKPELEEE